MVGRQLVNIFVTSVLAIFLTCPCVPAEQAEPLDDAIYPVPQFKPTDSETTLKAGDKAPDFTLRAVGGGEITLSEYRGKKNVVVSFVPAAWTPICTKQWREYNKSKEMFEGYDAILLGITLDNDPTLHAWNKTLCQGGEGVWFPLLSDFYPRGGMAQLYGVLRTDGVSERAIFVIDKQGTIRYIDVHDINEKPDLGNLEKALRDLQ
jgi:peroxiredoxin